MLNFALVLDTCIFCTQTHEASLLSYVASLLI